MNPRKPEYDVHEIFINRWSPRAMSAEPLSHNELMTLFEAARWAPSSFNNQPWRFVYAMRGSQCWQTFYDLMAPFNQEWAQHAGVLVVVLSKTTFDYNGNPARCHSHDTGAACENLALQGSINNLVVHEIEGFDYEKARVAVKAPDDYAVEVMIAIGKPGKKEDLSEKLAKREFPSDRKSLKETVFEGTFKV